MSTRVVDRVEDWDERSFTGGYRTLHEFADEGFSGVVRAGGAELYMTKGSVVGIRQGDIDDYEDASGTAYEAPSPALPLLAIMQETSEEVRAEYYSEKTAIAEVDSTLSDGGFTGYVELSDNVLSGDYYQVYHAGESMSVGFIGESGRLIDGDEAFETADDEVGIYQVHTADIDVVEIPDAPAATDTGPSSAASTTEQRSPPGSAEPVAEHSGETVESDPDSTEPDAVDAAGTGGNTSTAGTQPDPQETAERTTASASETSDGSGESSQVSTADRTENRGGSTTSTEDTGGSTTPTEDTGGSTTSTEDTGGSTTATQRRSSDVGGQQEAVNDRSTTATESERQGTGVDPQETRSTNPSESQQTAASNTQPDDAEPTHVDVGYDEPERDVRTGETAGGYVENQQVNQQAPERQEEQHGRHDSPSRSAGETDLDLETRGIPSLDPTKTVEPEGKTSRETGTHQRTDVGQRVTEGGTQNSTTLESQTGRASQTDQPQRDPASTGQTTESAGTEQAPAADMIPSEELEELEAELESEIERRETEIDRLESELERKTTEYEDAKEQLESVRQERDDLAGEVERLEEELERLETEFGATTDAEQRMTPAEALAQTDIFPRYASKGDATLEKAHDGSHRSEDVSNNLRIEENTQFDQDNVSVQGQSYEEFIESTIEFRFVQWVVRDLLFEIRETGHTKSLKDLYDALPAINRIDLEGTVDAVYSEEGQETRSQESFDIVFRNRMGEPLIVANINDSREGATESMMETLVRSAERVGQSSDVFAGAFLVTRSYFEPPALETADEATKGGLLSRDKRKSFVNLSRKQGYHLCLVEARNENFSLLVPEL